MRDMCVHRDNWIERIQWDSDSHDRIRSIGLKLAFVTRTALHIEDIENKMFEIRSPSGRYTLLFRSFISCGFFYYKNFLNRNCDEVLV